MSTAALGPYGSTFHCHDCRTERPCTRNDDGTYDCDECGSTILCDECGAEWTDEHSDGMTATVSEA